MVEILTAPSFSTFMTLLRNPQNSSFRTGGNPCAAQQTGGHQQPIWKHLVREMKHVALLDSEGAEGYSQCRFGILSNARECTNRIPIWIPEWLKQQL